MRGFSIQAESVKVFTHDFDGRTSYSVGISSKKYVNGQKTDEYIKAYMFAQFPRDDMPKDKDVIDIISGFLAVYEGREKNGVKLVVTKWKLHDEWGD